MMSAVLPISSILHLERQLKQHVAVGAIVFLSIGQGAGSSKSQLQRASMYMRVCYDRYEMKLHRCIDNITRAALTSALYRERPFELWHALATRRQRFLGRGVLRATPLPRQYVTPRALGAA